jgi:hypothetical protein
MNRTRQAATLLASALALACSSGSSSGLFSDAGVSDAAAGGSAGGVGIGGEGGDAVGGSAGSWAGGDSGGGAGQASGGWAGSASGGTAGGDVGGFAGATVGGASGSGGGGLGGTASGGTSGGGTGGTSGGGAGGGAGTGGQGGTFGCAEAVQQRSHYGCEFWPTPVANNAWSIFDFGVVVVNPRDVVADVRIERGASVIASAQVPANGERLFYLPWIPALKGPEVDTCGRAAALTATVRADQGGYRLTSTSPVAAYQFSPIETKGEGGPAGKSWSSCPGNQDCIDPTNPFFPPQKLGCFSFSNDASLLLPTHALTGTYRLVSLPGWTVETLQMAPYFAVTGTSNGTTVTVRAPATGGITAGGGISSAPPGGTISFSLGRGDVVQILGTGSGDLSGALVTADRPVQVISGVPCINQPLDKSSCDHIEESVFPAETLGKRYFVARPSAPKGAPVGHIVRFYGHLDGTRLTYPGGAPAGAPTTLAAGQVVSLGNVAQDFEVVGDKPFAVASFMLGNSLQDTSTTSYGDPSLTLLAPVEQFRHDYVFVTPGTFPLSYADVIVPIGARLSLDGTPVATAPALIGNGWGVLRLSVGAGRHVLTSSQPIGLQVLGFASSSSYHAPGGANFSRISG